MPDVLNSLEARLRYAREEFPSRYPECTCQADTAPLCDYCVIRDLLNEIGHVLADLETHFLGRGSR